ncbi:MAG: hypothetical protein LQ350_004559 [Teloschistes chrysophthalmus]|nr:MAG: hypothetical protein LQ350_004559 [Niorma chrysophthalma]
MSQGDSEGFGDALGGLTAQRSAALSNKLTGILSVSYTDSEIRDALRLLDQKQVSNTPDTRRQLRSNLQKEVIECNASIVKEFGQVAEQLKTIGSTISSLRRCCDVMRQQVAAARQENAPVLDEANALLDQKQSLEKKKQLLEAFNKHFLLPEDDILTLTSTNEAIDEHFFAVLARMKQIHSDCRVLLGSENQRLGLELMEQSSRQLNSGYQKLYRWIQKEFMTLDLENPNINTFIRKSLRTLAERPALFESCLDNFSEARDSILTDGFYSALTGSSADQDRDSTMKSIEFHAHDALRYIGDMLAWAHSATVSERESLGSLFIAEGDEMAKGIQAGRHSEPWSATDGESFDGRKALHDLVNRNMAGVARALRQRVEQTIQGQDDSITIYKIASLISFYRVTLTKLLGKESFIPEALTSLEASAMRQFEALQSDQTAAAQAELAHAPSNLSVPDVLEETLTQLKALMKSYESSLTPVESRETAFEPVLALTLKPILDTCENLSKTLDAPAKEIFLLNCCLASKSTLLQFTDFTTSTLEQTLEKIGFSEASLVEYQHYFLLHVSGLHPLLTALTPLTDSTDDLMKIHGLPPFQPAALAQAKQTLDDFLPSALMDALENLKELTDAKLAGDITSEAADRFCEDFEFVEGRLVAVDDLVEGEEDGERSDGQEDEEEEEEDRNRREKMKDLTQLRSLYPRTSAEIRVLLS